jgi:hypothetical protein
MFELVKWRCGIAEAVTVYDDDIKSYVEDCKADLVSSGVPASLIDAETPGVITAVTLYVKAHLGNDRADSSKYMNMYSEKVFRLALEDPLGLEGGTETDVE